MGEACWSRKSRVVGTEGGEAGGEVDDDDRAH